MKHQIYDSIVNKKAAGKKSFTVLIDPDKVNQKAIDKLVSLSIEARVDYFFVGGSLVVNHNLDETIIIGFRQNAR